jgi:4-amino-4-deoxy-L-arabinose transferase-like glycosyltransferase
LLTACVLVAVSGVVEAWRGRRLAGWLACGTGIGLGALTKGPVVLVHVLPVALLAPWWAKPDAARGWRRWYLGVVAALALGTAIGLAWALPAGAHGGAAGELDLPARFALAWVVPGVAVLSCFGGKQIHYLMPLLPGFAILAAARCRGAEPRRWDAAVPAGLLLLAGAALLIAERLRQTLHLPQWLSEVSPALGAALLAGALLLASIKDRRRQVVALSLTCPLLLIAVHLAAAGPLARHYDLEPVAALLKAGEQAGRPITFVGPYPGQFHFLGRLDRPFEETPHDSIAAWAAGHPLGLVVRVVGSPRHAGGALISRPYGQYVVAVWSASRLREE